MNIRPYRASDLPALYDICLRTGDAGSDASTTASHPRLLGDYFAAPYVEFDPDLCLILADEHGPCGYILGTADTRAFYSWFNHTWLPRVRETYRGLTPRVDGSDGWLLDLMQRDATILEIAEVYPAHLHIDILSRAQGGGWGRRMFATWIGLAAKRGAAGVHLGVAPTNVNAMRFYERVGMTRLDAPSGAVLFGLKL